MKLTNIIIFGPVDSEPIILEKFDGSNASRKRPIAVNVCSMDEVHTVIQKFNNFKATQKYSALSDSYERTPRQIKL